MSLNRRNNIDCKACKHLYITYNHKYPYGCRAFRFISKKFPYLEVHSSSGMKCALFSYRTKNDIIKKSNNKKGKLA